MKQITITIEYVYEKLKTIYEKRYYHNDYQKMHKKQLNLITKELGIEDLIIFNIETKQFEFNLIDKNYINMGKLVLFTDKKNTKEIIDNIKIGGRYCGIEKNIIDNINHCFNLITQERTIRRSGQLCTNQEMELYHKGINTWRNDFALKSMNEAMCKIYKETIIDSLNILYGKDISRRIESEKQYRELPGWKINKTIEEIEKIKVLNCSLDDFDYL
jgi:hypothetical protein